MYISLLFIRPFSSPYLSYYVSGEGQLNQCQRYWVDTGGFFFINQVAFFKSIFLYTKWDIDINFSACIFENNCNTKKIWTACCVADFLYMFSPLNLRKIWSCSNSHTGNLYWQGQSSFCLLLYSGLFLDKWPFQNQRQKLFLQDARSSSFMQVILWLYAKWFADRFPDVLWF